MRSVCSEEVKGQGSIQYYTAIAVIHLLCHFFSHIQSLDDILTILQQIKYITGFSTLLSGFTASKTTKCSFFFNMCQTISQQSQGLRPAPEV